MKIESSASGTMTEVAPRRASVTSDFILAILALLILQALIGYRRRRPIHDPAMNPGVILGGVKLANPHALWLLIGVGVILGWSLLGVDTPRKLFAPLLRAAVLALCVLALADPQTVTRSEGTTRPAVVDASASITAAMRTWTAKLLRDDLKLRAGDPAVIFATDPEPTTVSGALSKLDAAAGCANCAPGG